MCDDAQKSSECTEHGTAALVLGTFYSEIELSNRITGRIQKFNVLCKTL